jgi:hypothetical protein
LSRHRSASDCLWPGFLAGGKEGTALPKNAAEPSRATPGAGLPQPALKKEMIMSTTFRSALVALTIFAAGQGLTLAAVNAEPGMSKPVPSVTAMAVIPNPDGTDRAGAAQVTPPAPTGLAMAPSATGLGDIFGARGPNPHGREIKQIAIYESIGNEDGAAMLKDELHQFGVSPQALQRSTDFLKIHEGSPVKKLRTYQSSNAHVEAGWEASQ